MCSTSQRLLHAHYEPQGTDRATQEAKLADFGLVAFVRKKFEFGALSPQKENQAPAPQA